MRCTLRALAPAAAGSLSRSASTTPRSDARCSCCSGCAPQTPPPAPAASAPSDPLPRLLSPTDPRPLLLPPLLDPTLRPCDSDPGARRGPMPVTFPGRNAWQPVSS
eukprot:622628-Rhodomonas_salina.1